MSELTADDKLFGIVCEVDEEKMRIKIFDWKKKLVEVPIEEDQLEYFEVGCWAQYLDGECFDVPNTVVNGEEVPFCVKMVDFYIEDSVLMAKTTAAIPNELGLPRDLREKYQRKVWSPWVHFIRDEKGIFDETELMDGLVTVKYAPSASDDCVFELVSVEGLPETNQETFLGEAPWMQEMFFRNADALAIRRDLVVNKHDKIAKTIKFKGICVAVGVPNVNHNPTQRESRETTDILWSWELGLCRSTATGLATLGKWYEFKLNDRRYNRPAPGSHYYFATATGHCSIRDHLKTEVVVEPTSGQKILKITTSFIFDWDKLESAANRKLGENWNKRKKGLRGDAHFNDYFLAKVELYPDFCEEIIKKIEQHQKTSPEKKLEAIVITAKVQLLGSWNLKTRIQTSSIFFASELVGICCPSTGEIIYE